MTVDLEQQVRLSINICSSPSIPPENVVRLPGVGFHPWMEVDVLRRDLSKSQNLEEDSREILERWLVKAKKNLVGYWQEYIDQRLVLPIDLEITEIDGQRRVVPRGVKNATWVDSIGSWERNGSVKESAVKIEEFLVNAPPLSAAVLVSPGGREYPDTQTYIFWLTPDGQLESMTIRTDPDIGDNENFLLNSAPNFNPDTNAYLDSRVEAVIRNPLFLVAENGYGFSPESIIEAIRATKSGRGAFKDKEFADLFIDFVNRDKLLGAGKLVEAVIDEFTNFCIQTVADFEYNLNNEVYRLFEDKLGETVLKLAYVKRHLQIQGLNFETAIYRLNNLSRSDYQEELRYLQTIPGCAGGGVKNYVNNGFGLRGVSEEKKGPSRFCSTCEGYVDTFIIEGKVYCSLCGQYLGKLDD